MKTFGFLKAKMVKLFQLIFFVSCFMTILSSSSIAWDVGGSIYTVKLNLYDNKYIVYESRILDIQGDIVKCQSIEKGGTLGEIGYLKLPLEPPAYFPTWQKAQEYIQKRYKEEFERNRNKQ